MRRLPSNLDSDLISVLRPQFQFVFVTRLC